ncbi:MAG: cyclophilin-like fold protein [Thermoleophilia bacterium]
MARMRILIKEAGVEMTAELNDSTTTAALWRALPLVSSAQIWGAEVYFSVPLECREEDPQATVALGAVGYWPPGKALCLFFGQQPVSPVSLVGALTGDPSVLHAVHNGHVVRLERLAE